MRMRRLLTPLFTAVVLSTVVLAGCIGRSGTTVAQLVTNLPQIVSYVERFNALSNEHKVSVTYLDEPWRYRQDLDSIPELVVGTGLTSGALMPGFADQTRLLESIGPERFYPDLLVWGQSEGKQLVIPLSFALPMVMMRSGDTESIESTHSIDIDELRQLSAEITDQDHIGFSHRWQPDAAYLFTRFFGVGFHQTDEGVPAWNESRLREAVGYLSAWSSELNGGPEQEAQFERTYLHDPPYRLVADGRVRFALTTLDEYLNIPAEIAEQIDFRWFARAGSIPVSESIVGVASPKGGAATRSAGEFLTWLLDADTQERLLEIDRYRRVRGFGFAGGFSSMKTVNTEALGRYYPFLIGRIPSESALDFPPRLPSNWPEIRSNVIDPWLLEQSELETIDSSLSDRLLEWQRQHPDAFSD